MQIVKLHFTPSKKVENWDQIKREAEELRELTAGEFPGEHSKAIAVHHSQVSNEPFNFFCLNEKLPDNFKEQFKGRWCFVNPKIIVAVEASKFSHKEGCMSFPFRTMKHTERYGQIKVSYQYPDKFGDLIDCEEEFKGLAAAVFQHEIDHANGINIYGFTN